MGKEIQSMERDRRMGTLYGKLQTRNQMNAQIDQIDKTIQTQKHATAQIHTRVETSGAFPKTNKRRIQYAQNQDNSPLENQRKGKNAPNIHRCDNEWRYDENFRPRNDRNTQTPQAAYMQKKYRGVARKKTKRTTGEITNTRANMRNTKQLGRQETTRGNPNTIKETEKTT